MTDINTPSHEAAHCSLILETTLVVRQRADGFVARYAGPLMFDGGWVRHSIVAASPAIIEVRSHYPYPLDTVERTFSQFREIHREKVAEVAAWAAEYEAGGDPFIMLHVNRLRRRE